MGSGPAAVPGAVLGCSAMEFDEVVDLLRALDDTQVMIAGAENGAPEGSWGASARRRR